MHKLSSAPLLPALRRLAGSLHLHFRVALAGALFVLVCVLGGGVLPLAAAASDETAPRVVMIAEGATPADWLDDPRHGPEAAAAQPTLLALQSDSDYHPGGMTQALERPSRPPHRPPDPSPRFNVARR